MQALGDPERVVAAARGVPREPLGRHDDDVVGSEGAEPGEARVVGVPRPLGVELAVGVGDDAPEERVVPHPARHVRVQPGVLREDVALEPGGGGLVVADVHGDRAGA